MDIAELTPTFVFSCDRNYGMQLATAIRSLINANKKLCPLVIYILADGVDSRLKQKVQQSVPTESANLVWIDLAFDRFEKYGKTPHASNAAYARLMLGEVLPFGCGRIIYLDSDLLVLGSLEELWNLDLQGNVVGAVRDAGVTDASGRPRPNLDVPQVAKYFNSGVIVIDVNAWRQQRIADAAAAYLEKHPNPPYMDQDALNYALDGKWLEVPETYNFQRHVRIEIEALPHDQKPAIAHFVTYIKPWDPRVGSVNFKLFDRFRNLTEFARSPLQRWKDLFLSELHRLKRSVLQREL